MNAQAVSNAPSPLAHATAIVSAPLFDATIPATGDLAAFPALRLYYLAAASEQTALWTLTLTPLDSRLATQVRELKIAGQGSDLRSIELWLAGGDRSLMLIEAPPR